VKVACSPIPRLLCASSVSAGTRITQGLGNV
jgi:hypothetical protein